MLKKLVIKLIKPMLKDQSDYMIDGMVTLLNGYFEDLEMVLRGELRK